MGEVECLVEKWRRGVDKITGFKVWVNGGLGRENGRLGVIGLTVCLGSTRGSYIFGVGRMWLGLGGLVDWVMLLDLVYGFICLVCINKTIRTKYVIMLKMKGLN